MFSSKIYSGIILYFQYKQMKKRKTQKLKGKITINIHRQFNKLFVNLKTQ